MIFLSLFLVGCIENSPNREELASLKNEELERANEDNITRIKQLEGMIEENNKIQKLVEDSLENLLTENSALQELIDKSDAKVQELEETLKFNISNNTSTSIYNINNLEVGSVINEFEIVDIINDERSFQIEFKGYYLLEGYLALTELGHIYLHFYGDDERYKPFDFELRFDDGRKQVFKPHIGILNDDV